MIKTFLPGSTIGVLGSGQLGRMFTIAARRLGYRVHTFSPESDTPTGQVADVEWTAAYDDVDKIKSFAKQVDVVTFEFENVPSKTIDALEKHVPVHPKGDVLHTTQQRIREKTFLETSGFPVTPFTAIRSVRDIPEAIAKVKLPAVFKTAGFGYDGKGQRLVKTAEEAKQAFMDFQQQESILEAFVDFQAEMSVVAARNEFGEFAHYGVVENRHKNHILDLTLAPFSVSPSVRERAIQVARDILDKLNVIGVLCVEMFYTKTGDIVVNELAPRPHNSGHFTIDACMTSQFEQQLRAVCGLPLGSPMQLQPAAMVNLLGDLWEKGEPAWNKVLAQSSVKLHLYGKKSPSKGRKMGHITALGQDLKEAEKNALTARAALEER